MLPLLHFVGPSELMITLIGEVMQDDRGDGMLLANVVLRKRLWVIAL